MPVAEADIQKQHLDLDHQDCTNLQGCPLACQIQDPVFAT